LKIKSKFPLRGTGGLKTAPFDVSNSTEQADSSYHFNQEGNCNLFECSCVLARQKQRSICFCLDLFFVILSDYLFPSREKEK
jgi:hypothetical protein